MTLSPTDRTKLNNLSPNLTPNAVAISALRLQVFQEIYTYLDAIIADSNAAQAAGAVTSAKLADGSVITVKLADSAVTGPKILDGAIITAKLVDGGTTTIKIADGAITTIKILDGAVTTAKVADSNITTAKLADLLITTAKLANGSVTAEKIATGAVGTTQLADSSVTAVKIPDGVLTAAKFVPGVLTNETANGLEIVALKADVVQRAVNPMASPYNAVGNGTANDTTALQAVLNAAAGGIVILPYGKTFKITSALTVPDNTTLFAYGAKIINTSSHFTMLSLGSNCKIFGLELQGAGNLATDSNGVGISALGADSSNYKSGMLVRDCYIHGFGFYGIYTKFLKDSYVENCRIEDIGYAGFMGLSITNVHVSRNKIKGISPGQSSNCYNVAFTRVGGVDLATNPRSKDCSATFNTIEDNTIWEALDTHGGENILFQGNTIRNCKTGIALVSSHLSGVDDYAPLYCKAIGNTIYSITTGAGIVVAGSGLINAATEYAKGCVVSDNTIYGGAEIGNNNSGSIILYLTLQLAITGNAIIEGYANGINVNHTNDGFNITGNTIMDINDPTWTVAPCIAVRSDYNKGYIGGNVLIRKNASLNTYVSETGIHFNNSNANSAISLGNNYNSCTIELANMRGQQFNFGMYGNKMRIYSGVGSPEGVITASPGSSYYNVNAGAGTTEYLKETGTGNTGWVPVRGGYLTSIAATPIYVGQEALVTGVWYKAKGVSGTGDWVALN